MRQSPTTPGFERVQQRGVPVMATAPYQRAAVTRDPHTGRFDYGQSRRAIGAYRYLLNQFDPHDDLFFV